jgi:hypothetical protein
LFGYEGSLNMDALSGTGGGWGDSTNYYSDNGRGKIVRMVVWGLQTWRLWSIV